MSIAHQSRTNFTSDQSQTAYIWMEMADGARDSYLRFSAEYSAFNALIWCCSSKEKDREIVSEFKNIFIASRSFETNDCRRFLSQAKDALVYAQRNFDRVSKLHTRKNGRNATDLKVLNGHTLHQTNIAALTSIDVFNVFIELLYQFRCNLVHGSKSISYEPNRVMAGILSERMRELNEWLVRHLQLDV